jgi:hypothetical protein
LEFEDELAKHQRSDLAQFHRTEPPLDVRVPETTVLPASAPLEPRLDIQTPELLHELLQRLASRFERRKVAGTLE